MLAAGAQCRAAGLCGGVCRMAALMQSNLSLIPGGCWVSLKWALGALSEAPLLPVLDRQ